MIFWENLRFIFLNSYVLWEKFACIYKQEKEINQPATESLQKFLVLFPDLPVGSDFDSVSGNALHTEFTCACCGKTPVCVPILSFIFYIFMSSLPRFPVSTFKPQLYRLTVHQKAQNIGENFLGIPNQLLGENILWIIRLFFKSLRYNGSFKNVSAQCSF